jgi:CYTH domain-containing protein
MGKEIEHKFLVTDDSWREGEGRNYCQGYLSTDKERTVRVRIEEDQARLTIKGITEGATRAEYEYPIPVTDARAMLDDLCLQPLIEKRRYKVNYHDMVWEIDEFSGDNAGLVVAEIELQHPEQAFDIPPWIGEEVTGDPRFYNANLVAHPYSRWKK